jgi:hypothetical protein
MKYRIARRRNSAGAAPLEAQPAHRPGSTISSGQNRTQLLQLWNEFQR